MKEYDVVITGAGLAGLCCARWLAAAGQSVLLIDRKTKLDQSIHTTGIFVRRTLEDFSLPDDCLGPPVRDVKLYSPRRQTIELASPHDEFRVSKMERLYNHLLEAAIRTGAEWSPATSFVRSNAVAGGSNIELEKHQQRMKVSARFIIGADGANSRVARDLGLSLNREWIIGVEQVYDSRAVDLPAGLHCFLDPRIAPGYIAWLAHDGGEMHIGVGGYADRFEPQACLERFHEELASTFPLAAARFVEQRGGRIPVGGLLPEIVCERGLLVGDAAGAVSPLTAGGLDPCLRQSALAAKVIGELLASGDASRLAAYRSTPFRRRFRLRHVLRRSFRQINQPWLAEVSFLALRTFPFRLLARHIFFGRGSFPMRDREFASLPAMQEAG